MSFDPYDAVCVRHGNKQCEGPITWFSWALFRLDTSRQCTDCEVLDATLCVSICDSLDYECRGKDKAWLGTYHTPVNAAVHHDFFKMVLAVEGKIFTSRDMDACSRDAGRSRPHLLKMNFPIDELPALMRQAVTFTNLWHKYYQGSERYIFRDHNPADVETMVTKFIEQHCWQLREYVPTQPNKVCQPTVPLSLDHLSVF